MLTTTAAVRDQSDTEPGDHLLDEAVGRLLGDVRERAGLPQRVAAERAGLAQSRLARLERGQRRLLFGEALRLAAVYGVKVAVFDPRGQSEAATRPLEQRRGRIDLPRGPRGTKQAGTE